MSKHLRRILAVTLLCAFAVFAAYVQSGKSDFASAGSTVCSPGSVTAGHGIVMAVQANSTTSVTIGSTRVSSWTLVGPESQAAGTVMTYLWYGFANTSGAETITVSFTSGSALIGSGCAEVTSTAFDASGHTSGSGSLILGITTTQAPDDVVIFATSGAGSAGSGVTDRQAILSGGTTFAALGTGTFVSTGLNNTSTTASGTSTALGVAFYTLSTIKRHKPNVIKYHGISRDPVLYAKAAH